MNWRASYEYFFAHGYTYYKKIYIFWCRYLLYLLSQSNLFANYKVFEKPTKRSGVLLPCQFHKRKGDGKKICSPIIMNTYYVWWWWCCEASRDFHFEKINDLEIHLATARVDAILFRKAKNQGGS